MKLGETEKTRETLIKGLATTVFLHDGKKNRDRKKVQSSLLIHLVMSIKDFKEEFLIHAGSGSVRSGDSELWQDHRKAQNQKSRNKRPEGQILAEDKNESHHLRGTKIIRD